MTPIFITGGTGYIGKRLIKQLVTAGYDITALVRKGSEHKLPQGVRAIIADPFDATSFQQWIPKGATVIQLLGVHHPSPRKKEKFRQVDLRSVKTSADAAAYANAAHFIYVSVAMIENNLMKEYQAIRKEGEAYLLSKGLRCTFIRPWYVLGPGHFWPALLLPFYGVASIFPAWKQKAAGMRLITIGQMLQTLQKAIDSPPPRTRVFEISHIKRKNLPVI
ncbi:MAG: NAD-dependent epimerase/dehydratase family protein [Gammaproteobacteria bacterium]|nr:MAG: NAD-dependent epimerase/dehydratase family protein [Gammaproteobacteria bacterium]